MFGRGGKGVGKRLGKGVGKGIRKGKGKGRGAPPPTAPISPAQTDALVARAAPAESIDSVVRKNRKLGQETRKQFMTFPDGTSDHDQEDAHARWWWPRLSPSERRSRIPS